MSEKHVVTHEEFDKELYDRALKMATEFLDHFSDEQFDCSAVEQNLAFVREMQEALKAPAALRKHAMSALAIAAFIKHVRF